MNEPIAIHSLDDSRLEPYRNLRYGTSTRDENLFVAEGLWLATRLLQSDFHVHSVLVERRRQKDVISDVPEEVPVYVIPDKAASEIVGFNFHRGVLVCGRRPDPLSLSEMSFPETSTLVLGCRLQDAENLGLILRNSAAFGVDAVILGPASVDPYSRRVLRVSMGNAFSIPIMVSDDLEATIGELRQLEFDVAATVLDDTAEVLQKALRRPRQALVFGEEAHGVTPECIASCNRRITLAMKNRTDSLNVAVACGVFLYHMSPSS